jgi:hypothetical protein
MRYAVLIIVGVIAWIGGGVGYDYRRSRH